MVVKHRLGGLDPRAMMAAGLSMAALILTPFAALDLPRRAPSAGALLAVAALGVVLHRLAFVVFAVLIREAGTSRATVITYVNPVIALLLGVTLLGERPGAGAVGGLLLILAGSWLATGGLGGGLGGGSPRRRRAARGEGARTGAAQMTSR